MICIICPKCKYIEIYIIVCRTFWCCMRYDLMQCLFYKILSISCLYAYHDCHTDCYYLYCHVISLYIHSPLCHMSDNITLYYYILMFGFYCNADVKYNFLNLIFHKTTEKLNKYIHLPKLYCIKMHILVIIYILWLLLYFIIGLCCIFIYVAWKIINKGTNFWET